MRQDALKFMAVRKCAVAFALTTAGLAACGGGGNSSGSPPPATGGGGAQPGDPTPTTVTTAAPAWLRIMSERKVDGISDDLVTAGVGWTKVLANDASPYTIANSIAPTAAELRRSTMRIRLGGASAGQGVTWGPNIGPDGKPIQGEGFIAGTEVLAYNDDGSSKKNAAMLLQVPTTFNPEKACVLAVVPASAARIYTPADTAAWGLNRGCAVVQTDKGGGNGLHDLTTDTVYRIDGTSGNAAQVGKDAHYASDLAGDKKAAFLAQYPNRVSVKPYGKRNTFADWGTDVARSVQFAIWYLDKVYAKPGFNLTKDNTLAILTAYSSGAGAAVMGGEAAEPGLIDGIVVTASQVSPKADARVQVERAGRAVGAKGYGVAHYILYSSIYMSCASHGLAGGTSVTYAENACTGLKEKGLLSSATLADQALEASQKLLDYGYDPAAVYQYPSNASANALGPIHSFMSAYGKAGVEDKICNFTVALTVDSQGRASAPTSTQLAQAWLTLGGYAPQLIYEDSVGGPVAFGRGVSPSTGRNDYSLDGILCLNSLLFDSSEMGKRIQSGVVQAQGSGDLHGTPALVIHGRDDTRVPATLTARAYVGLNSVVDGKSNARYLEVTNVGHGGTSLTYYQEQGLNLMWAYLHKQATLPPHQVLRATATSFPPISNAPASSDQIQVGNGRVVIPD